MKFFLKSILIIGLLSLTLSSCSNDTNGDAVVINDETKDDLTEDDPTEDVVTSATTSKGPILKNSSFKDPENKDYSGVYRGFSWRGEQKGVVLEDASQLVETILTLDKDAIITDFEMNFIKVGDDYSTLYRNDPSATVEINYDVTPTLSILGDDYSKGDSMFNIETNDMMSFFAVGVNDNNTVAFAFVDPITRFMFESKFDDGFDFSQTVSSLTVDNNFIPTVRTSSSGLIKPASWDELKRIPFLNFDDFSYVIAKRGTFENLTNDSTIEEFLTMAGVSFENGTPISMEPTYGFHSVGGWAGNYDAIKDNLIGFDAKTIFSLADFNDYSYGEYYVPLSASIDENNFFGYNSDTVVGATRSIQNSYDTFTGATVRLSRENASFQRALVDAGLLDESDVIKARF